MIFSLIVCGLTLLAMHHDEHVGTASRTDHKRVRHCWTLRSVTTIVQAIESTDSRCSATVIRHAKLMGPCGSSLHTCSHGCPVILQQVRFVPEASTCNSASKSARAVGILSILFDSVC
jgi:hypothetical protein